MTIPYQRHQQELKKLRTRTGASSDFISQLLGKPFWVWDKVEHLRLAVETNEHCCFNHIVGLPVKDKIEHPHYDYEKILYDSLLTITNSHSTFKDKHLWVKKARGLGVTEFMLRLMAWLCTKDHSGSIGNSQMCIITGPKIDIATKLIRRLKNIFERKLGIYFDNKETVLELSGYTIEAYPSNHLDAYRSLENPKFILIDEGDSFTNIKNIFVDAANPELISSSKREVAEERDNRAYVQEKMAYCKKHHIDINRHMKVVPVPFSTEGKNMLIHTKELLEFESPIVAINPKFDKLITSQRTAISDDLGKLDKEATSYDNVLDAFRLSLQMFKLKEKERDSVLCATVD
jgi:hypothetical protein